MRDELLEFLVSEDKDNCRFLLCSLVQMLRIGKAGVLSHPEIRKVLADRIDKALTARAEDVSDALGITRGRSDASPYGNCKYDFILWYYTFLDKDDKPSGREQEKWLENYSGGSPSTGSTVNNWIREAKETYQLVILGAKHIESVT